MDKWKRVPALGQRMQFQPERDRQAGRTTMIGFAVRRRRGWALSAALLLLLAPVACAKSAAPAAQQKPETPPAVVTTAPVTRGTVVESIAYAGNIQAEATVGVKPRATGRLERLYVDRGSAVRTGDKIAELDQAQLNASVQQAQGALQQAQAKLDLVLAGARPEDVEAARAQVAAADT